MAIKRMWEKSNFLQILDCRTPGNLDCGTPEVLSFLRAVWFQKCKEHILDKSKFSKSGLQSSRSVAVPHRSGVERELAKFGDKTFNSRRVLRAKTSRRYPQRQNFQVFLQELVWHRHSVFIHGSVLACHFSFQPSCKSLRRT